MAVYSSVLQLTQAVKKERVKEEHPKPPLLKGGGPPGETRWRGDSVFRKTADKGNPPVTAVGGASHLGLRAAALRRLSSKRACGRSL